ncbi:hypothetical protein IM880_08105, partial [Pectobacterium polaris]|nr:hypothetical protein [Pectobacterium polaris]
MSVCQKLSSVSITSLPRSTITDCPVLKPSSSSHSYAAVSDGTVVAGYGEQVQDIATLSRDVEHAN